MARTIVILAAVAALLAVLVVVGLLIKEGVGPKEAGRAPRPPALVGEEEDELPPDLLSELDAAGETTAGSGAAGPAGTLQDSASSRGAASDAKAGSAITAGDLSGALAAAPQANAPGVRVDTTDGADASPELRAKVRAILRKLTPTEQEEMARQLQELQTRKAREQAKYALPSQQKLQELDKLSGGALKLSDFQRQQIQALNADMKPKVTGALSPFWDQDAQLSQQRRALESAGRGGETGAIAQELRDLRKQRDAVKQALDWEYRQMLAAVLTPEQLAAIGGGSRNQPAQAPQRPAPAAGR